MSTFNFNPKNQSSIKSDYAYEMLGSERRKLVLVGFFAFFSLSINAILGGAILFLVPLKTTEYILFSENKESGIVEQINLPSYWITPSEILQKHFLGRYVLSREQFFYPRMEEDATLVRGWSEKKVYEVYSMGLRNKETQDFYQVKEGSLVAGVAEVQIQSIEFLSDYNGHKSAQVRFRKTFKNTKSDEITNWMATILYTFEEPHSLTPSEVVKNPTGFKVLGYSLTPYQF